MLFKKMIRDLWKNKVQFGAIFIMMFLGVFIFSGISSEYHGLEVALNNYIKENNLADAWLYQKEFSDSTLNELKKQTDYEQRMSHGGCIATGRQAAAGYNPVFPYLFFFK